MVQTLTYHFVAWVLLNVKAQKMVHKDISHH